jgi:hypothetical protein
VLAELDETMNKSAVFNLRLKNPKLPIQCKGDSTFQDAVIAQIRICARDGHELSARELFLSVIGPIYSPSWCCPEFRGALKPAG